MRKIRRWARRLILLAIAAVILSGGNAIGEWKEQIQGTLAEQNISLPDIQNIPGLQDLSVPQMSYQADYKFNIEDIPEYSGTPYYKVNGNIPFFTEDEIVSESFERYSDLDSLGRCGEAVACVGKDIMPTEERGKIGMIKPSGWQSPQIRYDFIDQTYLYNRCHLLGYQLTGENANEKNLITGTRYMNVEGMLPFENEATWYVEDTGNHLMYRVTPIFVGTELLARGVLMEALSVEDGGKGCKYCVFVYNVQPNITIDYATGKAWSTDGTPPLDRS